MHYSNLKRTQMDVWIFMYLSELESDDTALIVRDF